MGCCSSRDPQAHPLDSGIQEALSDLGYYGLKVRTITQTLYPITAQKTDDWLSLAQVQAIGSTLGVLLPAQLFRENTIDTRIRRKKVYLGLVLMSGDGRDEKAEALAALLGTEKRQWVRFLEWREELLVRLVVKAVSMQFADKEKADSALASRVSKGCTEIISTCESLWQTELTNEALKKQHLGNISLSAFHSTKK